MVWLSGWMWMDRQWWIFSAHSWLNHINRLMIAFSLSHCSFSWLRSWPSIWEKRFHKTPW
jgi:hypothetical protein